MSIPEQERTITQLTRALAEAERERDAARAENRLFKSKLRGLIEGFESSRQWYLVQLMRGLFAIDTDPITPLPKDGQS